MRLRKCFSRLHFPCEFTCRQIKLFTRSPSLNFKHNMARRDRSYSPDAANKRVRSSYRSSPRSPSPTRRNVRPSDKSRYDDRDRDRGDRDRERERDRYRDERYRDDRRRDSYRDERDRREARRDDRRPRSRSRDRRERDRERDRQPSPARQSKESKPATPASATPPVEDEKLRAKRERLEAWKKEREAKKALDEAKAKAMALAGKSAPREYILNCLSLRCWILYHLI